MDDGVSRLDDYRPIWIPAVVWCGSCGVRVMSPVYEPLRERTDIECPSCFMGSAAVELELVDAPVRLAEAIDIINQHAGALVDDDA